VNLLRRIWSRFDRDECIDMAAQVSFYFILSLFPFFLVVASLLGWIPTTSHWQSFAEWITAHFPRQARLMVFATVIELSRGYAGFLSLGVLATIWSASTGFLSLMKALSVAYGVKDSRSYVRRRAIAIGATLVAALFIILSFGLWNVGHVVVGLISNDFRYLLLFQTQWELARWAVTLLLMCLGIDLINYFLPAAQRPWRWFPPSTILLALSFVGATLMFNLYLTHASYIASLYGTLAGFIVLMLWIYIANLILLIGAETDTALRELRSNAMA
jgi:membrane protein